MRPWLFCLVVEMRGMLGVSNWTTERKEFPLCMRWNESMYEPTGENFA